MDKATLFTKAHALTRATIQAGDSYQATFGLCLRHISSEAAKESNMTGTVNTTLGKPHGIRAIGRNGKRRTPAAMGNFAIVNAYAEQLPFTTLSQIEGFPHITNNYDGKRVTTIH